jgi:hypothetical protein
VGHATLAHGFSFVITYFVWTLIDLVSHSWDHVYVGPDLFNHEAKHFNPGTNDCNVAADLC